MYIFLVFAAGGQGILGAWYIGLDGYVIFLFITHALIIMRLMNT